MSRRTVRVNTEGKPWARYLRLSKAEAAEDRDKTKEERLALTNAKLDNHLAELTRWMDAKGLPHDDAHIYRDPGLSAWKPGVVRPDWEQMMACAERGELGGIGIVAVDRFTRDVSTMEDLIKLADTFKVNIGGPRAGNLDLTTYEGIQQARGMAMQAANESLATSFRIKETLAHKMANGKPMGGGRCFGFEVGGEVQRPAEVAVIREVVNRMLAGESLLNLAADLNDRGLTTVRNGPWTGGNLGRMLGAHRYGGRVEHHGQIVGVMPGDPVLDEETYEDVQALLASRRRGRRPTGMFLLTGLLTCSTCQRTMNGAHRHKTLADGTRQREYRCPIQLGGCGRVILAEPTEALVGEEMVRRMSDPTYWRAIEAEYKLVNEARAARTEKAEKIKRQLTALAVKWANEELIDEAYEAAKAVLDKRLAKLTTEPGEQPLAVATRGGSAAPEQGYDASLRWANATSEQKRELIQRYRLRPVILAKQPGTRRFDPDRVTFP